MQSQVSKVSRVCISSSNVCRHQPRGPIEWQRPATCFIYNPTHQTRHYLLKKFYAHAPDSSSEHRSAHTGVFFFLSYPTAKELAVVA
jgi:hypothetical protein